MNKTVLSIIALSLIGCATICISAYPKSKRQDSSLLAELKKGNVALFEENLAKLPAKKLPRPAAFYKACCCQVAGKYKESDLYFQGALKLPSEEHESMCQDILFALIANAYFENNEKELFSLLGKASPMLAAHPLFNFFEGLSNYISGNFSEAAFAWQLFLEEADYAKNGKWGTCVFEQLFSRSWVQLHLAHCLTENGDYLRAREILEREMHSCEDKKECREMIALFLGLTYIKEAETVVSEQRSSYYQLAAFYMNKGKGLKQGYERDFFSRHLEEQAKFLIEKDHLDKKCALEFISLLEEWHRDTALTSLGVIFASKIIEQKDIELLELVHCINANNAFSQLTFTSILGELSTLLRKGQLESFSELWTSIEKLCGQNKVFQRNIVQWTLQEMFESIKVDDKSLKTTMLLLRFWQNLEHSNYEMQELSREFFAASRIYWQKDGQEAKGEKLMEIAYELDPCVHKDIESYLCHLYCEAENSNMIRRLSLIYDALRHFGFSRKELASPSKVANYLADAQYLYRSRNYLSAQVQAAWVLKLDSENEEALRLIGLTFFHLGEYNKARTMLAQLSHLDEQAHKALLLSHVYCSEEEGKQLAQIDHFEHLYDN